MEPTHLRPRLSELAALIAALIGGLLLTLSVFFRYSYGPMGAELSYYKLIAGNFTSSPLSMLLVSWHVAWGMAETCVALASWHGRMNRSWPTRWQWLRLIAASYLFLQLNPIFPSVPFTDILRIYGPGYWMMLLGGVVFTVIALHKLMATRNQPPNS